MQNWPILGPKKGRNSKKYFFSAFFTEEMYTFRTSIIKNIFRGIFHLIDEEEKNGR